MALTYTQTSDTINRLNEVFMNGITENNTFSIDRMQYVTEVRDKFSMVSLSGSNFKQAYAKDPASQGTIGYTDEEFTISKYSIRTDLEYDALKNTQWLEAIADLNGQDLPEQMKAEIIEYIAKLVSKEIGEALWNGDGDIDGFFAEINADLTAATLGAQILSAATVLTVPANIQGVLTDMYDAANSYMKRNRTELAYFVSPAVAWAYTRSLQLQNMAVLPSNADSFGGIKIVEVANLADTTIILGNPANMAVGFAAPNSEFMNMNIIDQRNINGGNFAKVVCDFGYNVGIATTDFVTFEDTTA